MYLSKEFSYQGESFTRKTNIMDSALYIYPDQPAHSVQANPDQHISSGVKMDRETSPETENPHGVKRVCPG